MGAKYFPTIKDLKASQRFQQKQKAQQKPAKTTGVPLEKAVKTTHSAAPGKPSSGTEERKT